MMMMALVVATKKAARNRTQQQQHQNHQSPPPTYIPPVRKRLWHSRTRFCGHGRPGARAHTCSHRAALVRCIHVPSRVTRHPVLCGRRAAAAWRRWLCRGWWDKLWWRFMICMQVQGVRACAHVCACACACVHASPAAPAQTSHLMPLQP